MGMHGDHPVPVRPVTLLPSVAIACACWLHLLIYHADSWSVGVYSQRSTHTHAHTSHRPHPLHHQHRHDNAGCLLSVSHSPESSVHRLSCGNSPSLSWLLVQHLKEIFGPNATTLTHHHRNPTHNPQPTSSPLFAHAGRGSSRQGHQQPATKATSDFLAHTGSSLRARPFDCPGLSRLCCLRPRRLTIAIYSRPEGLTHLAFCRCLMGAQVTFILHPCSPITPPFSHPLRSSSTAPCVTCRRVYGSSKQCAAW
jgi:hypothetical protein